MSTELIQVSNNEIFTTSRAIADNFNKRHTNVIRKVEEILAQIEVGSILSAPKMFERVDYLDAQGKTQPEYRIDRDGFALLAMSFTGSEALQWKLKYIAAFNAMEEKIRNGNADRRLEIAKLIVTATPAQVKAITGLYPEYYQGEPNSLEYAADLNTGYCRWIADYNVSREWIGDFPTVEVYDQYVRYCMERRYPSYGKKTFYRTLETDFNLRKQQRSDGKRYFLTA